LNFLKRRIAKNILDIIRRKHAGIPQIRQYLAGNNDDRSLDSSTAKSAWTGN
jgi:hypothetical protein